MPLKDLPNRDPHDLLANGRNWEWLKQLRGEQVEFGTPVNDTDPADKAYVDSNIIGGTTPTGPASGVLDGNYPGPGLAASVAGNGLAETSDVLSVNVDGTTIEINSDALRVKDDGITAAKIAADAVGSSEIAADAVGSSEIAADAVGASELADDSVASANIINDSILNVDVNSAAAIAYSKLNLASSVKTTDLNFDVATQTELDAEASTRSTADSTEASTRASADTTLQTNITTEAATRASADTAAIATAEAFSIQRANHTGTQLAATVSDFDTQVRTSRLDQMASPSTSLSINSHKLINVTDPTAGQDAATKAYVDAVATAAAQGLSIKEPVRCASTVNITYDTVSATTITGSGAPPTIDGVTLAVDDRVLLKNQTLGAQNGIWTFATTGTLFGGAGNFGGSGTFGDPGSAWSFTRSSDADTDAEVDTGMFVPVTAGTANLRTAWILTTADPITIGTTSLTFVQQTAAPVGTAGGALDGTYPNPGLAASVAGNGLAETSDVLSVNVDASTIEINSDTLRVKAGGIGTNEIATDGVGTAEIAADAVTNSEIATDAVDSAEIKADAVGAAEIATGAVGNGEVSTTAALTLGQIDYPYICLRDEKTANTAGGTFTAATYAKRTVTEFTDTGNNCSVTSSVIVLAAGTYRCRIECPAFFVVQHKARLRNTTDSATVLVGTSEDAINTGNGCTTRSLIVGSFTIAASKNLEIQHNCNTTRATDGMGLPSNLTEVEVYTVAEFWRVS